MISKNLKFFYNSKEWIQLSDYIRKKYFHICQDCGKPNSKEVHHVIPVTELNVHDPTITLNPDNLVLLCNECHNKRHNRFIRNISPAQRRSIHFDSMGNVVYLTDDNPTI